MGVHASAIKKDRQALRRRERNRAMLAAIKTVVKKVRSAVGAKNAASATQALAEAVPALSKAAAKKLIHKNKASRLISRLTRHSNRLSSSASK
ncbi:MAG: 30S ribosomal protein S20 [Nitrospirae bacterium]|nr:30S ribosomal protein S20 [Nitrospirota bacterium]